MAESSENPQNTWCFRKSKSVSISPEVKNTKEENVKKWRKENPERVKEHSKKWREENSERVKEHSKKWREENPEKVKEQSKKWREENPEKIKKYNIDYRNKKSLKNNLEIEVKCLNEKMEKLKIKIKKEDELKNYENRKMCCEILLEC